MEFDSHRWHFLRRLSYGGKRETVRGFPKSYTCQMFAARGTRNAETYAQKKVHALYGWGGEAEITSDKRNAFTVCSTTVVHVFCFRVCCCLSLLFLFLRLSPSIFFQKCIPL